MCWVQNIPWKLYLKYWISYPAVILTSFKCPSLFQTQHIQIKCIVFFILLLLFILPLKSLSTLLSKLLSENRLDKNSTLLKIVHCFPISCRIKFKLYFGIYKGLNLGLSGYIWKNRRLRSNLLRTLCSQRLFGKLTWLFVFFPLPPWGMQADRVREARCYSGFTRSSSFGPSLLPLLWYPHSVINDSEIKFPEYFMLLSASVCWFILFLLVLISIPSISHLSESFKTIFYTRPWVSCRQEHYPCT